MKRYFFILIFTLLLFTAEMSWALDYAADLSIDVGEQYNDNIFLTNDNKVHDFITFITPGISLSARSATSELRLSYSPTFYLYSSNSEENNTAHNFYASGSFKPSHRLSLTIADSYIKSRQIRDIVTIQDFGPIRGLSDVSSNSASAGLSYMLSNNLSIALNASYANTNSEAPDSSDVKTYAGTMSLTYTASERTSLSANAGYSKSDFTTEGDSSSQTYTLSLTQKWSPTLSTGVTGGVVITKTQNTGQQSTNFSGGATITKTFETRGSATLSYTQSVVPSSEEAQPLTTQTVSFNLSKPLTDKLTGSLTASYSRYKSLQGGSTNTNVGQTYFGGSLAYSLTRWAFLALSYSYVNSDDKVDNANDYRNNIVALSLRFIYSTRPTMPETQPGPQPGPRTGR